MNTYNIITIALLALIGTQTSYLTFSRTRGVRKKSGVAIIVDTSVLIDGRIISIAESGFVTGTLVVPRSVVAELQYMADNADHDKRVRARYGLDVIQHLQSMKDVDVQILQDNRKKFDVDTQLVELAKRYKAHLCTVDYNLNKVAQVEGVVVLNVNELAQALRAMHLPGERRMLALTQKGSDGHQAVGYLEDGTMVVVEHSNKLIGQTVFVEFTRVLQTQAGKMMFAKRVEEIERQTQKPALTEKKSAEAPKKQPKKTTTQAQAQSKQVKSVKNEVKDGAQKATRQAESTSSKSSSSSNTEQQKQSVPKKAQPRRRRKKTNEESLVELANRSDT